MAAPEKDARAPYELDPPQVERNTEAWRRYRRSRDLVRFQRDLDIWKRAGTLDHPRNAAKVAYRRECLQRWEDYLEGRITPHTGARPKRSEM